MRTTTPACDRGHEAPLPDCASCHETALVAGFLTTLARQPEQTPLPDAAELLRRARVVERLFHAPAPVERAMRRLALAELLGIGVSAIALGAWLVRAAAGTLHDSALPSLLGSALASPQTIAVALGAAAVAAALPLLLAWPLLAED
jgi:hypothetical protein